MVDELGRVLGLGPALGNDHDATGWPCQTARSAASKNCGAERCPGRCSATPTNGSHFGLMSAAVKTAATPGACLAAALSIETMRGVRMRTAHEAGVQHARQLDVVDVAAVPAEQALELAPRNSRADTGG